MNSIPSFNSYIEQSIIKNWNLDALTDYKGATLQYHDVARKMKLHILFENSDVKKGDKIAVCGRNSSQWAAAFLAIITYGAVVVPIQNEFKPEQIHNIVNHSGSKLLLLVMSWLRKSTPMKCLHLKVSSIFLIFSLVLSRSEKLTYARENLNAIFGHKYPKFFRAEHIHYHVDDPGGYDQLYQWYYGVLQGRDAALSCLVGQPRLYDEQHGSKDRKNCNILVSLPMAHMYGLMADVIFHIGAGQPYLLPHPTS